MNWESRRGKHTRGQHSRPADSDKEWFEQNPDQDERLRPITDAELEMLSDGRQVTAQTHVLITHVAPGVRKRQSVTADPPERQIRAPRQRAIMEWLLPLS